MDGQRRRNQGPQIYTGEPEIYAKRSDRNRQIRTALERTDQSKNTAGPLKEKVDKGAEQLRQSMKPASGSGRYAEQENARKMKVLSIILVILAVLLAFTIVYEVILGNGTRESGSQRMAQQESVQTEDL